MRFGLVFAIGISILMIGIASWTRFESSETLPSLHAVPQANTSQEYQQLVDIYLGDSSTTTSDEPLSGTDLIGRQLMIDYISLATSGKASDSTLEELADRYVESIPTLDKAVSIDHRDIQTVPNTPANIATYNNKVSEILTVYQKKVIDLHSKAGTISSLGPSTYTYAKNFSKIYAETALSIQKVPVPLVFASAHIKLINNYRSSSAAMDSISKTEQDPAVAFAGLIIINKNLEEETLILNEMNNILNGS